MLSRDIETVLGGRYLDISVFPYSFSEYLKAVGVLLSKNWQYGRKANELQRNFRTYFLTSSLRTPKIFVKEFSYFLMPCHQHGLGVNLLVQR